MQSLFEVAGLLVASCASSTFSDLGSLVEMHEESSSMESLSFVCLSTIACFSSFVCEFQGSTAERICVFEVVINRFSSFLTSTDDALK
jgi:hypothetical protein